MVKNIVMVVGPGTATAVAGKFGAEGFAVSVIGRSEDRLAAGVAAVENSRDRRRCILGRCLGPVVDSSC